MNGPLSELRAVELGGIGPGPHAAMLFADLGADVVRADRGDPAAPRPAQPWDWVLRGHRVLVLDLELFADEALTKAGGV